jgi:hypothetical protein
MNREEELTDIVRKVEWGQMDSAVAFYRILRLFSVVGQSEQLPTDIEVGKMVSDLANLADDEMER